MTKFTLSLIAGTAALAVASPALAQDRAPQADQTRAGVQERAQKAFERMDANKDGKIDTADREARRKAMFDRVDADHSGQISYAEFTAKRERPAGDQTRAGKRGGDGRKMAWSGGKRGPGMHRGMRGGMGQGMFGGKAADANSDGALTLAEFQAAALARFDKADADKNGTVTAAERKAQREAMRQQWQQRREQRAG